VFDEADLVVLELEVAPGVRATSARSHAVTAKAVAIAAAINIDLCVLNIVVLLGKLDSSAYSHAPMQQECVSHVRHQAMHA